MESAYCLKHNPIVKKIFIAMLAPTILMNLTTSIGSMADTMIIGHYLDDAALSVVTFATPIYMIINTLAALFAVGGCVAMSVDTGRGDKKSANQAFSLAVELLVLTGLLITLAGVFFSSVVTEWLGAGADVFEDVRLYSRIVMLGGPIFTLNIGVAFFARNDGRAALAMAGMFASIVVDMILNFVFVGFMGMGVAGAAYSTVIGQLVSALIISTHFLSSKNTLKFRFTFGSSFFRIIKNGASSALHFVYQFLTILILNHYVVALAGTDGVVVYTVVFNLYTVSLSVFEGISQTIQPMIGVYFGENSNRNMKETLRHAFIATLVICGSVTLFMELVPGCVPKAFGISDANLIAQSVMAVRIYSVSMIIMTINVIIGYYLQSLERTTMSAWLVSLRCCILFLASAYVLGKAFGMNGIWASYTTAEVLTFGVFVVMNIIKRRSMKKEGIDADVFFLNKAVENELSCYTLNCRNGDFDAFCECVGASLSEKSEIGEGVAKDTMCYISQLKTIISQKGNEYLEVEINGYDNKVIIRDNLKHSMLGKNICDTLTNGSHTEYGPVLGWNRICLK